MSAIKKAKQKLVTPPSPKRVVPNSGNESDSSTAYNHPKDKLEHFIAKQLAQDIESFGDGYKKFFSKLKTPQFVSKFCEARYDEGGTTYGTRGAPVRDKIRRRIQQWHSYVKRGTYASKVLSRYLVQEHSLLKKQQLKTPQEDKELLQSPPSSSSSLSDSNSEEESKGQQQNKIARKKRNAQSKESPQRPREIFPDTIHV
jgi:hypothetical protein